MRKLLYVLIFVFIVINFILFYIDRNSGPQVQLPPDLNDSSEVNTVEENVGLDIFQKIDLAFIDRKLDKKLIYTKKTDSLWFKYIKVPDSCSLSRYNLFFQNILKENKIEITEAVEHELSEKMIYRFKTEKFIPATVELRVTKGLESDLNLNGSICVIIYAMGNDWGKEWVKNLLSLSIPLTVSILPNNPPAWARDFIMKEVKKNNREILICLPMEPDVGNIDKENPVKILKGMNKLTTDIVFEKMSGIFPDAEGIINFKGSKVIADYETMDLFFKKLSNKNMIYIESETGSYSYSELLCDEYKIPYISSPEYFNDLKSLEEGFERISVEALSGKDILIVVEGNEDCYKFLTSEAFSKYRDINYLTIKQFIKQRR